MASSSNTTHSHRHMKEEEVAADAEANWLQLGLGLGLGLELGLTSRSRNQAGDRELESNPVHSASGRDHHRHPQRQHVISSSTLHFVTHDHEHQHERRLGLGLGLGVGLGVGVGVSRNVENDVVVAKQQMGTSHVAINISSSDDEDDECNNHTPHEHNYYNYGHRLQSWHMPAVQYHMMSGSDHHHPSRPPNHHHYYNPTTRSHHGLWFTLLSSTNRNGELALPQIPRTYIRVKDENVTVFMVKKYLVRKLIGLSNEAEVDISCMGQKLMHTETLKHVRDCVWLPRIIESVDSRTILFEQFDEDTVSYLMCLTYARARPCV